MESVSSAEDQISFRIEIDGVEKKGTLVQLPTVT